MIKKSILITIFVAFIFLFVSCSGFNLFKPKNMGEIIKNLPPEQQVTTAQEALSSAETDEDYINVGEALADEFNDAFSDGVNDDTEAAAAEIIATAYIQASPVGDIISEITQAQTTGSQPDLETIFNNLANDTNQQQSLVIGLLNGATYTGLAADYDSTSSEPDVDLQLTNAILNIGAAIIEEAGVSATDDNGNGTVDNADVSNADISGTISTVFADSNGDGVIDGVTNSDASASFNEAKNSLQTITNTINDPNDPIYQLADSLLQMLP